MDRRIVAIILLFLFICPLFAENERIVILNDGTYLSTCRDSLVQRSNDGGITWTPFPGGLPESSGEDGRQQKQLSAQSR